MVDPKKTAGERSFRNRFSRTHRGVLDDPGRIDEDGVLGEQAFAAYMGIPESEIVAKGPVAYNFKLLDGTRVDVRASRVQGARLIVPPMVLLRGKIDAFVLAQINPPAHGPVSVAHVVLKGWATPDDVKAVPTQVISRRPGATPVHALWNNQLRPMDTLKRHNVPQTLSLFGDEGAF